jgi:hypothetical protein
VRRLVEIRIACPRRGLSFALLLELATRAGCHCGEHCEERVACIAFADGLLNLGAGFRVKPSPLDFCLELDL